jgi:hypothetical protein
MGRETARGVLERLPDQLGIRDGNVRIRLRYTDGTLQRPIKATVFRIPAARVNGQDWKRIAIDATKLTPLVGELEQVAQDLRIDTGDGELVVEYGADQAGHIHLRWLDISCEI